MDEYKYYVVPSPFPTLARGLFSVDVTDKEIEKGEEGEDGNEGEGEGKKYRIVARGYDKFFNIGEVPWTTVRSSLPPIPHRMGWMGYALIWLLLSMVWDIVGLARESHVAAIHAHAQIQRLHHLHRSTQPLETPRHVQALPRYALSPPFPHSSPFIVIVIFACAIGPIQGVPESHAQVGDRWLNKHLQSVGKTREELAQKLWDENWTAVAEVRLPPSSLPLPPLTYWFFGVWWAALRRLLRRTRPPLLRRQDRPAPARPQHLHLHLPHPTPLHRRRLRSLMGLHPHLLHHPPLHPRRQSLHLPSLSDRKMARRAPRGLRRPYARRQGKEGG